MKTREKTEFVKYDFLKNGHNCVECQPYIKGEMLKAGCLTECRSDSSKRGGDAFHIAGCQNQ